MICGSPGAPLRSSRWAWFGRRAQAESVVPVAAARSPTRATHAARSCASATICPRASPRRMTWCTVPGRRFRSKGGTEGSGRSAEGHRAAPVRASSVSASCLEGVARLRNSPLSQQRPAIFVVEKRPYRSRADEDRTFPYAIRRVGLIQLIGLTEPGRCIRDNVAR